MNDNVVLFNQKTAYEMRISDWSSDVCSSDLKIAAAVGFVLLAFCVGFVLVASPLKLQFNEEPDAVSVTGFPPAIPVGDGYLALPGTYDEIGRASCRERVCQYV